MSAAVSSRMSGYYFSMKLKPPPTSTVGKRERERERERETETERRGGFFFLLLLLFFLLFSSSSSSTSLSLTMMRTKKKTMGLVSFVLISFSPLPVFPQHQRVFSPLCWQARRVTSKFALAQRSKFLLRHANHRTSLLEAAPINFFESSKTHISRNNWRWRMGEIFSLGYWWVGVLFVLKERENEREKEGGICSKNPNTRLISCGQILFKW